MGHWKIVTLECHVELHGKKDDPSHHHSFVIYITYNPASQKIR